MSVHILIRYAAYNSAAAVPQKRHMPHLIAPHTVSGLLEDSIAGNLALAAGQHVSVGISRHREEVRAKPAIIISRGGLYDDGLFSAPRTL